jgi:hypothetical protein
VVLTQRRVHVWVPKDLIKSLREVGEGGDAGEGLLESFHSKAYPLYHDIHFSCTILI